MNQPVIILASASPRRAELLRQMALSFVQQAANIDEQQNRNESPADYVVRMSLLKCKKVLEDRPDELVLGSDTVVVIDNNVLGKPKDRHDYRQMFAQLSGRTHDVLTAVTVAKTHQFESGISRNRVTFAKLSESVIEKYWQTGEPMDKAGGYAIQGQAAMFITNISGSYSGVMGLPVELTANLLALHKINVWDQ